MRQKRGGFSPVVWPALEPTPFGKSARYLFIWQLDYSVQKKGLSSPHVDCLASFGSHVYHHRREVFAVTLARPIHAFGYKRAQLSSGELLHRINRSLLRLAESRRVIVRSGW